VGAKAAGLARTPGGPRPCGRGAQTQGTAPQPVPLALRTATGPILPPMLQPLFVGDVQGCADELEELVARAAASFGHEGFVLHLVGDLVNRGPASLPVLERVRRLEERGQAVPVLGNHDLGLVSVYLGLRELRPTDTFADVLRAPDARDWIDWLRTRRVAVAGRLGRRAFAMVHASVAPAWDLAALEATAGRVEARLGAGDLDDTRAFLAADPRRDPDRDALGRLVSCRSVAASGTWSSAEPTGPADAWHARWAAARHDYGVVYGHWATQGLHVAPGLRGLDTGCVHHGRGRDGFLTAWLPDPEAADPFALPDPGRLWQARARRPYYRDLAERERTASGAAR